MGDGGFPVAGGDTWALDSMHTWLPGFGDEGWGEMDLGTALFLPVLSGQSAGGGGGGAGGVDAKALGICTKLLFGVSLESFTAAQGGLPGTASNGSFIGVMAGVYQGFGKPPAPGPSEFTVVADVSLDQHGVTAAWNFSLADYNLKYGTQYPQAGSDIIAGFTNPLKPFSNHVASNSSNILGTQIYELGNSLSFISSQQMENPGEFGMQYEAGLKLFNCYKFLESN
jgi:hypothetical protein